MKQIIYPPQIEPYTIEVEATNYCTANCIFCNNKDSLRNRGFLDKEKFDNFLKTVSNKRKDMWLNKKAEKEVFPKIVFGGLGEPLLHPNIIELIKSCKKYGLKVKLITNASLLHEKNIDELFNLEIDEISVSLHSLNPIIYNQITGLNLNDVFPNVKCLLEKCKSSNIIIEIWRVYAPVGMLRDTEEDMINFNEFVSQYPFVKVFGPSEPWSRDGKVENSVCNKVYDNKEKIWCHKIYFTFNIAWDGKVVLCCNDYNRITCELGNVFDENFNYQNVINKKNNILNKLNVPKICLDCSRWSDTEYFELFNCYLNKLEV